MTGEHDRGNASMLAGQDCYRDEDGARFAGRMNHNQQSGLPSKASGPQWLNELLSNRLHPSENGWR